MFDLDGVLTDTAAVHNKAWTEMFDAFLRERAEQTGESFVAFDPSADYSLYVDGKPRPDGVRDFLASRGIRLPEGSRDDVPGVETVHGLGNRKNEALLRRIREEGVEVFEGSRRYLEAARDAGLRRVVCLPVRTLRRSWRSPGWSRWWRAGSTGSRSPTRG